MKNSTRIIVNTGAQYIRSILSVLITLYTSRVILENLGIDDFGIYNLIAGVVTMLSFIQVNLSRSTQRFLNYYIGKNDKEKVKEVFSNSVQTQIVITILLCAILMSITEPLINKILNIPADRIEEATIVYWIMIASLFFNLLSSPFNAALIAHENIVYSSIVQTGDALLKLPIAISLYYVSNEKLVVYAAMMFVVTLLNFLCYSIFSIVKYNECKHINLITVNWGLAKEMFSFMIWTMYGTFCVVGRTQGIAILLNRSFSTTINAAYGIGNQIIGNLSFLSVALMTAINPQIVKAEGSGDRTKCFRLAEIAAKYSFLLISVILIPVFVYMDTLLEIWLTVIPPHTAMFCRWTIIISLLDWTTQSLNTVNTAIGNVRKFNLMISTIILLTIPTVYIILLIGFNAEAVMVVYAIFTLLTSIGRLIFLQINVSFPVMKYCKTVVGSILPIFCINLIGCFFLSYLLNGWWFLISGVFSVIVTVFGVLIFGLKEDERIILCGIIKKVKSL